MCQKKVPEAFEMKILADSEMRESQKCSGKSTDTVAQLVPLCPGPHNCAHTKKRTKTLKIREHY